ncbi:MAG TPA: DsbA family protein [Rhizobiales bacterium]|nr:DsbA family protein [Hyphomicrobiales bacterium]
MKLNRRNMIAGSTALVAGASSLLSFSPAAFAGDADPKEILVAPSLGDRIIGKADAPVTIVEYASATCPHCARFHAGTFVQLKKDYIDTGKVRFIFREFPFDDLALAAFMLTRCAPEDKYFGMLDVIFERQQQWTRKNPREELLKIAKLAGFTEEDFDKCLKNEKVAKGIYEIRDRASKKFEVNSTPSFFINGKFLAGNAPIDTFKKMIDAAQ